MVFALHCDPRALPLCYATSVMSYYSPVWVEPLFSGPDVALDDEARRRFFGDD